jgi:hypothetical protein
MIGLNRQATEAHDLPRMFIRYLLDDLPQAVPHGPDKHLAGPVRAPDDVLHDKMDVVPFMLIVHAYSTVFFSSACKAERPFIPRLKPRGILAHFQ